MRDHSISVTEHPSADGETSEWSLVVGDDKVWTLWLQNATPKEAFLKLLKEQSTQIRCARCGKINDGRHADTCPYRRAE